MADNLVRLIIFLLFISFRSIASDFDRNQEENSVVPDQHVRQESTAGERSGEDRQDQAPAAGNADSVKSQEKPGFFSQIISEFTAPLYEQEEEDFLADDSSSESFIENQEEATKDSSDKSQLKHQENGAVLLEEKQPVESNTPQFRVSNYLKSVTENAQTAQTVYKKLADEKVVWAEVASHRFTSSEKGSDSVETVYSKDKIGSKGADDNQQDHHQNHRDSTKKEFDQIRTQTSSELSDEDLEHLRVKRKDSVKEKDEMPRSGNEDPDDEGEEEEEVGDSPELNQKGGVEFQTVDAEKKVKKQSKWDDFEDNVDPTLEKNPNGRDLANTLSEDGGDSETTKGFRGTEMVQDKQEEMPVTNDRGESPGHQTVSQGEKRALYSGSQEEESDMAKQDQGKQISKGEDLETREVERTMPLDNLVNTGKEAGVKKAGKDVEIDQQKASDGKDVEGKAEYSRKNAQDRDEMKIADGEKQDHEGAKERKNQEEMKALKREKLRQQQEEEDKHEKMDRTTAEKKLKDEEDREQRLEILRKQLKAVEHGEEMEAERRKRISQDRRIEAATKQPGEKAANEQLGVKKKDHAKSNHKKKEVRKGVRNGKDPGTGKVEARIEKVKKMPEKRDENFREKPKGKESHKLKLGRPTGGNVPENHEQESSIKQEPVKSGGNGNEDWKIKGARLQEEEAALKRKLQQLMEERLSFEKLAEDYYKNSKPTKQPKEQKKDQHTKQRIAKESPKTMAKEQEEPAKVDQATILLPAPETSITSSWTPTPVKKIIPTKTGDPVTATASSAKETPDLVILTEDMIQPSASSTARDTANIHTPEADLPEGAEVTKPPKVVFDATRPVDSSTKTNVRPVSAYAAFMQTFRKYHAVALEALLSYWPAVRNGTKDVLSYVGLATVFAQLCDDLAFVHPAVLFSTFFFGTLGTFYFVWSFTFGRIRHGTQGPHLRDVMKSQNARIGILEEEVKTAASKEYDAMRARDQAIKEMSIFKDQLDDGKRELKRMQKELERSQKKYEQVNGYLESVTRAADESKAEAQEKDARIAECEDKISELETEVEAKQHEIGKLANDLQEKQVEIQANRQNIKDLTDKLRQGNEEIEKLNGLLQEAKDKKHNLQVEFDDQLLRMTEIQQQYNFKCDEVEVLQDCLKQIKGNPSTDEDKEESDPAEMEKRLEDMMNVYKAKAEAKKALEERDVLAAEFDEYRKTNHMLKEKVEELEEKLLHVQAAADQAALIKREKEIELETLQRYFKSTEVELHRKLTAEESARINTQNQLQSEQAKASTAVVDADKYRQLYLEIKQQIEEIDERSKEQLSNMEAKAHQNWLDYRAAAKERDAITEENDLLRRKLYDMEVRGSRPSSSASSNHINHVDGGDSPRQSPHMAGPPGHGSPVPFAPMMNPRLPPPPAMFPRRHAAPPRLPFPPAGHVSPPPPALSSTPQPAKPEDRNTKNDSILATQPLPSPMAGFGPRPLPPMMGMPRFPLPPPMMPPPGKGPLPRVSIPAPSMLRGSLPPSVQGPRPSS